MKNIKISVVIPTFNEEKRILNCLLSLKKQDFSKNKFEIILVDGSSEDRTVEISRAYADKIITIKERKISAGRNKGGFSASGDIIVFTNADTIQPENWLKKIYDHFSSDEKLIGLYGPVYILEEGLGKSLSKLVMPVFLKLLDFFGLVSPVGSNMAVRSKEFKDVGGFNEGLITCEDIDLSKRMLVKGMYFKFKPDVFLYASERRIKKMGYLKYCFFHLENLLKFNLTGKSSKDYPPIR